MKSLMKKIAAVALAAATALGMAGVAATTANAAGPATLTVTSDNAGFSGNTVTAYQMFSATPNTDGESATYTLNSGWKAFFQTKGVNGADDNAFSQNAYTYVSALTDSAKIAEFAASASAWAAKQTTLDPASVTATEEAPYTATFSGLNYGYYLVTNDGADSIPHAILTNVTKTDNSVALKSEYPTVDKTVTGTGTKPENTDKGSSAQIGDTVNFTVKSKVPNYTEYTADFKYTFKFTDTLSKGLTFKNDVKVTVNGTALTADQFDVTSTNATDDATALTIDLAKSIKGFATDKATIGTEIVVTYSATVNEQAVAGQDTASNSVKLIYSNDPNNQDSVDDTPESKTHTYTFNFDLKKVDAKDANKTLAGAVFHLAKKDGTLVNLIKDGESYRPVKDGETGVADGKVTTPATGVIKFTGLAAGEYQLVEDQAPNGYNKLTDPISVTITATYNADGTLNTSNVAYSYGAEKGTGTTITVKNNEGTLLPGTGGMGTVAFTVVGVIVIALGVAWAIQRKRANA
ncbi:cell surface protein [Bifidobacterium tissieri]|uniref:Cell surface protein n=1 Tax=Bifidobacterium tissieri TaxID=1630162 RepID=A0A261F8D5_9BIFI|nr:SpaH/EbpB family LPXTG-anchored major pilin [Bifidobacterium tissieri]OZG55401.1 cell surface protein [Bifidobacterium tissieri]